MTQPVNSDVSRMLIDLGECLWYNKISGYSFSVCSECFKKKTHIQKKWKCKHTGRDTPRFYHKIQTVLAYIPKERLMIWESKQKCQIFIYLDTLQSDGNFWLYTNC